MQLRDHMEFRYGDRREDRLIAEIEHMIRGIRISKETYFTLKNMLKSITILPPYPYYRENKNLEWIKDYEKKLDYDYLSLWQKNNIQKPPEENFIEEDEMKI